MQWKPMLVAACVACVPLAVSAAPSQGDRLVTLSGSGASDNDFDNNSVSVSFDVGQYMTDNTVVGIRQSLAAQDLGDDSAWNGATRVFADYHFGGNRAQLQPFVGASLGGVYGDGVNESFFAGPEAGMKYFVKDETFVSLQAEYQFFFDSGSDIDDNFSDGSFVYSAGFGVLF